MSLWWLGLRLLGGRSGDALGVLLFALSVAVTAVTTLGLLGERLTQAVALRSAEGLGAGLVIQTSREPLDIWERGARERGLQISRSLEFGTMLSGGDGFRLVSARAVDDAFPLIGRLRLATSPGAAVQERERGPARGELWLDATLYPNLGVATGDSLRIGEARLRVAGTLVGEPLRGGGLVSLTPRVLMHWEDLESTAVIQPGSRLTWRLLVHGPEGEMAAYRAWVEDHLGAHARLIDARQPPNLSGPLERGLGYLGLSSLAAVLLGAVAVALAARRYAEQQYDSAALLRAWGLPSLRLAPLFLGQMAGLVLVASLIGGLVGWGLHLLLLLVLTPLLPPELPGAGLGPWLAGSATALLTLTCIAGPELVAAAQAPPLRVLRRTLDPALPSRRLALGLAVAGLWLLAWLLGGDPLLAAMMTAAVGLLAALFWLWGRLLGRLRGTPPGAVSGRLETLAFALAVAALASVAVLRGELLERWQNRLPPQAPNHFAINILPERATELEAWLQGRDIQATPLYPMVRARLTAHNGAPFSAGRDDGGRVDNALRRELNLSWAKELPSDNALVAGRWWQPEDASHTPLPVSVEVELAGRLGLQLGDRLSFSIVGQPLEAQVVSLRSVDWESFHPNFFMIFPPDALAGHPHTYITSFHLPPERKPELSELVRGFPAVSVLEIDQLLAQADAMLGQLALAVELMLALLAAAALAVLAAAALLGRPARLHEAALARALGARRAQLRRRLVAGYARLGLRAGLIGSLLAELLLALLAWRVLDLPPRLHPWLWLLAPALTVALVSSAGLLATRTALRVSPLRLLRP